MEHGTGNTEQGTRETTNHVRRSEKTQGLRVHIKLIDVDSKRRKWEKKNKDQNPYPFLSPLHPQHSW
jgi:hypothetical protein